jgi:signal transduction histidine kinase
MRVLRSRRLRRELGFLAALVAFTAVLSLVEEDAVQPGTRGYDVLAAVLLAIDLCAIAVRKRWPVAATVVAMAALLVWYGRDYGGGLVNLPLLVVLYNVAVTGTRRRTLVIGLLLGTVATVSILVQLEHPEGTLVQALGWMAAALLLGEAVRASRALLAEARQRAARAEAEREAEAERRVAEDRLRIARELHDVMAHTISAMTVQAGVAADALDDRPEAAREALRAMRATAREAMEEVRATVALLRDEHARANTAPAPALEQLDELVETSAAAGVEVFVTRTGQPRRLPALIELTAYRIVQEALTNVVRHAPRSRVDVRLDFGPEAVVVEVADDGGGATATAPRLEGSNGQGFGLRGMDERVAAVGGTVEHGPQPEGGFRVRAELPLGTGP